MIEVRQLQFSYPGATFSLDIPDLRVASGEKLAIVGPKIGRAHV